MGLSPNAPIFLFDIRGVWWFDPHSIAGVIIAFVFFSATLGSATRDPKNSSRLLYIPPDLRELGDQSEGQASADESSSEVVVNLPSVEENQELAEDAKEA